MKKKRSSNGWYSVLFIALILAAISIVIINVVTLIIFPLSGKNTLSYEENAIANILNILGLAVTVWMGLSIVDRMDRSIIQDLEAKAKEIEERLSLADTLERQLLLDDLQNHEGLVITQWIIQCIEDVEVGEVGSEIWKALREENRLYHNLRENKASQKAQGIFERHKGCVENLRKLLERYKSEVVRPIVRILDLRAMEAYFLIAYKNEISKPDAANYFAKAIKFYNEKRKEFGIEEFSIPDDRILDQQCVCNQLKNYTSKKDYAIWAYIFNFIGESYSKIVDMKDTVFGGNDPNTVDIPSLEHCEHLALNCCLFAVVTASEGKCQRETYYRNYGCAIERVNSDLFEGKEQALRKALVQYKEALKLDSNNYKVYSCLTSVYNDLFEEKVELKRKKGGEIETRMNDECKSRVAEILNEFRRVQEVYLACFPHLADAYKKSLLYHRNQYLVDRDEESARMIADRLYIIDQMEPSERNGAEAWYKDAKVLGVC